MVKKPGRSENAFDIYVNREEEKQYQQQEMCCRNRFFFTATYAHTYVLHVNAVWFTNWYTYILKKKEEKKKKKKRKTNFFQ